MWSLVTEKNKTYLCYKRRKFNTSNNSDVENQALVTKLNATIPYWEDNQGHGYNVYSHKRGTRLFATGYIEEKDDYYVFID